MKPVNIRLTEPIYEWVKKQAELEGVPMSTMIRTLLDRIMFADSIDKQFDKKKRGK